ncbi:hypothetical protein GCM10020331_025080 [Ectobacillus funiculus]
MSDGEWIEITEGAEAGQKVLKKNPSESQKCEGWNGSDFKMIRLKHVYKTYQQGALNVPVLHDIDVEIEGGEFVSIMGPSGSGKINLNEYYRLFGPPDRGGVHIK